MAADAFPAQLWAQPDCPTPKPKPKLVCVGGRVIADAVVIASPRDPKGDFGKIWLKDDG
jgi:hypothetical protein